MRSRRCPRASSRSWRHAGLRPLHPRARQRPRGRRLLSPHPPRGVPPALRRRSMVLFGPPPNGVIVLRAPPPLVPDHRPRARSLSRRSPKPRRPRCSRRRRRPSRCRCVSSLPRARARAVASWIPWWQAAWFRRLCYALPPAALRGHRVALLEPALLVLAGSELAGLPFRPAPRRGGARHPGAARHAPRPPPSLPIVWPSASPSRRARTSSSPDPAKIRCA
jgi:hypothetical protein